jgi:hypothetical protein
MNEFVLQGRIWDVKLLGGGAVEAIRIQTKKLTFLEKIQMGLLRVRLFKAIEEGGW